MKIIEKNKKAEGQKGLTLAVAAEHWATLADNAEAQPELAAKRARAAADRRSEAAGRVASPVVPAPAFSSGQRAKLRQAEINRDQAAKLLASAGPDAAGVRTRQQKSDARRADHLEREARRLVREVEIEREALVEQREVAATVGVGERLARLRDEAPEVETVQSAEFARDRFGATMRGEGGLPVLTPSTFQRLRITGRDGLALLSEPRSVRVKGKVETKPAALGPEEAEAGARFRGMVELIASDLRSQLGGEGKGGGDVDAYLLARAKAGRVRMEIERAVALELRHEPVALVALRRIAGDGLTVRELAGEEDPDAKHGGRAHARYVEGLKAALAIAVRVLRLRYPQGTVWVQPGFERGGEHRPDRAPVLSDEAVLYVTPDGERLFEAVRKAKRPA